VSIRRFAELQSQLWGLGPAAIYFLDKGLFKHVRAYTVILGEPLSKGDKDVEVISNIIYF
jgi:hypothetical protein